MITLIMLILLTEMTIIVSMMIEMTIIVLIIQILIVTEDWLRIKNVVNNR